MGRRSQTFESRLHNCRQPRLSWLFRAARGNFGNMPVDCKRASPVASGPQRPNNFRSNRHPFQICQSRHGGRTSRHTRPDRPGSPVARRQICCVAAQRYEALFVAEFVRILILIQLRKLHDFRYRKTEPFSASRILHSVALHRSSESEPRGRMQLRFAALKKPAAIPGDPVEIGRAHV